MAPGSSHPIAADINTPRKSMNVLSTLAIFPLPRVNMTVGITKPKRIAAVSMACAMITGIPQVDAMKVGRSAIDMVA